jgi:hypothetical protein
MITHIEPKWNVAEYQNLSCQRTWHKDLKLNETYVRSGHSREMMTIYNRFETEGLPESAEYIRQHFRDFDNVTLAVMLITPGHYLPLHWDLYGAYRRVFNTGDRRIFRAMIMLEDCYPGQILQVGEETHGSWRAGAVFSWYDDVMHATYNFSQHDRWAVQVTGTER